MKAIMKKNLALIIAFVLVLGIFTPILPGLIKVGANADEAAKIEEIKEAWSQLYYTIDVFSNTYYEAESGNRVVADKQTTPATDAVVAGSKHVTYSMTDNPTNRTEPTAQNTETYTMTMSGGDVLFHNNGFSFTISDMYVPYKVNSVTKDGSLAVRNCVGNASSTRKTIGFEWRDELSATDETNGTWQKLSLYSLKDDNGFKNACTENGWSFTDVKTMYTRAANKLRTVSFQLLDGAEADISFGPLKAVIKATLPVASSDWGLRDWVLEADELDLSIYQNSDALAALIEECKAEDEEIAEISELKKAWASMSESETIFAPTVYKGKESYTDAQWIEKIKTAWGKLYYNVNLFETSNYLGAAGTTAVVADKQDTPAADKGIAGDKFVTYSMTDNPTNRTAPTAQNDETYTMTLTGNRFVHNSTVTYTISDIYVPYRVNSVTKGGSLAMRQCTGNTASGRKTIGFAWRDTLSATDATNGTWQQLSFYGLNTDTGFTAAVADSSNGFNFTNIKDMYKRAVWGLRTVSFQLLDGAEADISFGPVMALVKAVVPTNSWTVAEWVTAAKAEIAKGTFFGTEELAAIIDEYEAPGQKTYNTITENANITDIDNKLLGTNVSAMELKGIADESTKVANRTAILSGYNGTDEYTDAAISAKKVNLANYSDVYMYYKVDSVTADGKLQPMVYNDSASFGYATDASNSISITAANTANGTWQKIPFSRFVNNTVADDWKVFYKNITASSAYLAAVDGLNAKITFGSLIGVKQVALPTNTAGWGAVDWIVEAKKLDVSKYDNTADFTTILSELNVKYASQFDIAAIKSAWGKMNYNYPSQTIGRATFYCADYTDFDSTANTHNPLTAAQALEANPTLASGDINTKLLGDYVGTFNMTAATDNNSKNSAAYFSSGYNGKPAESDVFKRVCRGTVTLTPNMDNIYLYYKVLNVTNEGKLLPRYQKDANEHNMYYSVDNAISVTADDVNKGWQVIEASDFFNGTPAEDWRNYFNASLSGLNVLAIDGLEAQIAFGSVVTVNKVGLPAGSDDWSLFEWLYAGETLDTSDMTNVQQFKDTIQQIIDANYDYFLISNLKKAWTEVASTTSTIYRPTQYTIENTTDSQQLVTDKLVTNTENMRDFGTGVATYDVKDRKNRTELDVEEMKYDTVYLSNASASGNWVVNGQPYFKVAGQSDIYFYYKVNDVKEAGELNIMMGYGEGNRGTAEYPFNRMVSSYKITVDENAVQKGWQKVSISEIVEGTNFEDWKTSFTNYAIRYIGLMAAEGVEANITFGSLVGITEGKLPENSGKWNIADWVASALNVDQSIFAEDKYLENFRSALDAAVKFRDENGISRTIITETHADASTLDLSTAGTNLLAGLEPDVIYYNGTKLTELGDHKWKGVAALSDNDFTTDAFAENVPFDGGATNGKYVDVYYTLKGTGKINKLVIAHSIDEALRNQQYSVSIAANYHELFSPETIIANKYDNTANDQIQTFSSGNSPDFAGRYIGIRIYNPCADIADYDSVVRFAEMAAYGELETVISVATGNYDNIAIKELGHNLLNNPGVKYNGKNSPTTVNDLFSNSAGTGSEAILHDGDINTTAAWKPYTTVESRDEEVEFYIGYDLKDVYDITKVLVQNVSNAGLQTGIYEVYASTLKSQMFAPSSKIFRYDNRVAADGGPNGSTITQVFNLHKGSMVAQYVAFRIVFPVCDWERAGKYINHESNHIFGRQGRLADLGFYGELYQAPERKMNIIGHTPLDVYRTNANGEHIVVGEDEYSGSMHRLTYDELITAAEGATPATIKQNGNTIDMVFNLSNNMRLRKLQIYTLTKSMKHVKLYTSLARDEIWNESSCVAEYNGDATDTVLKEYPDSPLVARYFRISVLDTVNGEFDLTEIEAIGYSSQAFSYLNLVKDRSDTLSLYLEEKETGYIELHQKNYGTQYMSYNYPVENMLDTNEDTVTDLYNGKNNKVSMNMVFNMGGLQSIDRIAFHAASTWDYWPTKLRFYFADRFEDLWGDDNIDKSWTLTKPSREELLAWSKNQDAATGGDSYLPEMPAGYPENGLYEYDIVPKTAQFVRVEILEADNHNYDSDKVLGVISTIEINGFALIGTVKDDGSVLSFTDRETGVRVDIMALEDNDVYDVVKGIAVDTIEPSEYFLETIESMGMKFVTNIYDIHLLDKDQLPITDVGGRQVKICIPKALYEGADQPYIVTITPDGEIVILESNDSNDQYYFVTVEDISVMQYALAVFTTMPDEPSSSGGPETPSIGDDDDEGEEEETDDEDESGSSKKRRKKIKVIRRLQGGIAWWIYVIIGVAALVVIGGVLWYFLYFRKKRKQKEEAQEISETDNIEE